MLLNVRLDPEDEQFVRGLRQAKVNVSALVRRAIRAEAAKMSSKAGKRSASVREALNRFPAPQGFVVELPALDDRRATAEFIRQRLTRK